MKKTITLLLALVLAMTLTVPVFAKSYKGEDGWQVTHTKDGDLITNFTDDNVTEEFASMEPGDKVTVSVTLKDEYDAKKPKKGDKEFETGETRWYIKNDVLKTFEETAEIAENGKYTYELIYTDPSGNDNVLYSSEVGNNGDVGLHQATDELNASHKLTKGGYFVLDTLKKGDVAKVTLKVTLDGPVLDNDFQKTWAKVELDFGIKHVTDKTPDEPEEPEIPKTGDTTKMLPYFIIMAVSGLALLVLAVLRLRGRKNEA